MRAVSCAEKTFHTLTVGAMILYLTYGMFLSGGTALQRPDWVPLLFLPLLWLFFGSTLRLLWIWGRDGDPNDPDDPTQLG